MQHDKLAAAPAASRAPTFVSLERRDEGLHCILETRQRAGLLGIQGIPTMILFYEGKEVARTSGAMSTTQIVRWVRDRLPTVAV